MAIMGMASYGLLDGLLRLDVSVIAASLTDAPRRATGWFLLVVAALFAVMWLAMIIPAIPGGLPAGRMTYGIASAVHSFARWIAVVPCAARYLCQSRPKPR